MKNNIIPYNPKLKELARQLRSNSTLAEVMLWKKIKSKALGYEFHRQVAVDEFIVDFYCHELKLAIEIDGNSHQQKFEYDVERQNRLESLGIKILRFEDSEVKNDVDNTVRALENFVATLIAQRKNIPLPPSKGDQSQHI